MKKMLLTTVFCVCIQFLTFGSSSNCFSTSNDSLNNEISKPALHIIGTRVYKGDTLLTKNEVLNILRTSPDIATRYEKGKNLRNTGGLLIAGSIISMTGGIVLMIKGIETNTTNNGYYNDSDISYNNNYYLGLVVVSIGELMLDGGIACNIIGKIQIRRSINNYNASIYSALKYKPGEITYQLGLLDNGKFGLRLVF